MKTRVTKIDFLDRFKKVHSDRYDYSKVHYINSKSKVIIICKISDHGEFYQTPSAHWKGQGCTKCQNLEKAFPISSVIQNFKKVHGDYYDYSVVDYKNAHTRINVICKVHGVFEIMPHYHQNGGRCPKCFGRKIYKTSSVIQLFKEKHGDTYDYSEFVFEKMENKAIIICKIHGKFEKAPSKHINGQGCPTCSITNRVAKSRTDSSKIIQKFERKHNFKYDYSQVVYKNSRSLVKIICKKHGVFEKDAYQHIMGQGCPLCTGKVKLTTKVIIDKFIKLHGNRYDYSLVEYVRLNDKVRIKCQLHGIFEQTPHSHLKGSGCPKCAFRSFNQQQIIQEFNKVHGGKYDYSLVNYFALKTKVKIKCKLHGIFEQTPENHLNKQGCSICNHGWTKNRFFKFLNSIENSDLLNMDSIELQLIINQGKLPDALEALVFNSEGTREHSIKALKESLLENDLSFTNDESLSENQENFSKISYSGIEINQAQESDFDIRLVENEIQDKKVPISLSNNIDDLHVIDNALVASCDEETVNFLIQYKLRKLWNNVLNEKVDIKKLRIDNGGKNFKILKDLFFSEYDEVISYKPPIGYSFKFPLLPMQQLTVYRVLKNKRYGNWSGTGAGKTISFIVTSRAVESKVTLLIGLNSTINQLADAITEVYPDSKVFKHYELGTVYDRSESNYLILNYDKFQQGYSEELFQDLSKNNVIDFIGIDEVHNVKQRSEEQESIRRGTLKRLVGRASENNPNLYLLGMSATPVINNLTEARSLLELITGKEYEDLNTTRTLTNALEVFKHMTLNGLRYMPKYDIAIKELDGSNTDELKIDGSEILEKLLSFENNSYLETEQELLKLKLKAIDKYLCKGAIIYSYFTHKMILPIVEHLRNSGYKVATYTGEESMDTRELNKEAFLKGQIDILVGSRPIGTGVDGLQKVCKRLIILSLPWTDSEFTQLKGRIYRQGSKFNDVEIIIPQVYIPLEEREWSWDAQRLNLIKNKKTLADAAVDGLIPSRILPSPQTLYAKSIEALREWKQRISDGKIYTIVRKELKFPLNPEIVQQLSRKLGDFSEVNRVWSVSKSETTHDRLKKNPEEWYYYHTLYAEKRKEWDQIPYIEIAKMIKRKDFVVADLGCGENLLKLEIPDNKVLSFDHISIDPTVTSCDLSNVPLDSEEVDVAVFSLALMGSNYEDYLLEAHRILKPMGFLFIAEPMGKWEGKTEQLEALIQSNGFSKPQITRSGNFIYVKCEKN
jgi:superfamily II DNA or RNA helicase